jgi:2-polyprenyl-6-hydroxyphenyl methylase/3-demethylubiquinone-9 3-methyltransferase
MAATRPDASAPTRDATLDEGEVRRFGDLAAEWWDPTGKFRPLHKLGPARLAFIRQEIVRHFARPSGGMRPFADLSVLDIGCGGGLVSEPVARLGASVTGIDPAPENIAAAAAHAASQGMAIDYRACRVEDLVVEGRTFDCVLCLEVVEHVPDVAAFLAECAKLVRPGGLILLSTINRTVKAYALAIVGAEYILRWLPVGTHQWERFVTPDELARHANAAGLAIAHQEGLVYNPLTDAWLLSPDLDVNYMASAGRPA